MKLFTAIFLPLAISLASKTGTPPTDQSAAVELLSRTSSPKERLSKRTQSIKMCIDADFQDCATFLGQGHVCSEHFYPHLTACCCWYKHRNIRCAIVRKIQRQSDIAWELWWELLFPWVSVHSSVWREGSTDRVGEGFLIVWDVRSLASTVRIWGCLVMVIWMIGLVRGLVLGGRFLRTEGLEYGREYFSFFIHVSF